MSKGRHTIRRRRRPKQQRAVFWIFTDGQNTERGYFDALSRDQDVSIEIPKECAGKSPDQLVDIALARKKEGKSSDDTSRDQFWVVFDDDGRNGVKNARTRCQQRRLKLAISNPCFELWLLLHFVHYDRPDDQDGVQRELERHCPDYKRHGRKLADFDHIIKDLKVAEGRAKNQENRRIAQGNPNGRPSTQVYKLTRALRGK